MTTPCEVLRHWWEYYRERPFLRLSRLFVERIFRGGGDADVEGLDLGVGVVLTFLALPGGFVSILLFEKYGTLLQWMRGATNLDPFASAIPDEYFFITLSMAVTGGAAVWRWESILPDRRDFMNLAPLPISTRTIFFANLVAVLYLAALIALDVNAASCILFPLVVGATQNAFLFFLRFAIVHAVGVVLASIFAFFGVFSMLGVLMAILPPRPFKRTSPYVRGGIVVYLVILLGTSFAVPNWLQRLPGSAHSWTLLMPSCWFLGFCQLLRGHADAGLAALARLALPGLWAVVLIAVSSYAVGYRRHFSRIAEMSDTPSDLRGHGMQPLRNLIDALVLRTPFQKGCFRFAWNTLFRSEAQRLVLIAVGGLSLVLASQAAMNAFESAKSLRKAAMTPDALSIPFVVGLLVILGVRAIFEIPVELRCNWIFRLMLDSEKPECEPLAKKMILILVLPWIVLVLFPVYGYLEGVVPGLLHAMLALTWTVLLTNTLLIRFRKVPFTCSRPLFQQHSVVLLLGCVLAFFIFAVVTPQIESWALADPVRMIAFIPVAAVAWYVPRYLTKSTMETDTKLIFEESPARTIEVLQLGE
jgi:hypothetical protein